MYSYIQIQHALWVGFPGGCSGKESTWQHRRQKRHRPIPGSGRSLEEGVATHHTVLAWKTLWTEEPGQLQFIGSQRVGHDLATKATTIHFVQGIFYASFKGKGEIL